MHKKGIFILCVFFLVRCIPCRNQGFDYVINLSGTSVMTYTNGEFISTELDTLSISNFYFEPIFEEETFSQLNLGFTSAIACDPATTNENPIIRIDIVAQDTINDSILPDSVLNELIEVTDYQMEWQSLSDFNEALSTHPDFLLSAMRFTDLMPNQNVNIRVEVYHSNGIMQAQGFRNVHVIP